MGPPIEERSFAEFTRVLSAEPDPALPLGAWNMLRLSPGDTFEATLTAIADTDSSCTQTGQDSGGDSVEDSTSDAALTYGSFSGTFMLESIFDNFSFAAPFALAFLPPATGEVVISEEDRAAIAAVDDAIVALMGPILNQTEDPYVILSQFQSDGSSQHSYGRAVDAAEDGSKTVITVGSGDAHTEFFWFDAAPCVGFPHTCQDVSVHGFTVGGAAGLDVFQGLIDIDAVSGGGPVPPGYGFGFEVDGELILDTDTPSDPSVTEPADSLIADVQSGTFSDGRQGVKVTLSTPDLFADVPYLTTANVFVRDDEGAFYFGSYGVIEGTVIVQGFCGAGDCPEDGSWPGFDAALDENGIVLFSFDSLPGNLTVVTDVQIDDDPDPDSQFTASPYRGGEQLPFGNIDLDC